MINLDVKKLVRFIKSEPIDIGKQYLDLDYKFYASKGNEYLLGIPNSDKIANIGITAHYDIVMEGIKGDIYWDKRRNVMFGKVSGDDRAGCYGIYEVAKRAEYKPYILLFDGEESGSIGCQWFLDNYEDIVDKLKLDFVSKCNFFISLDREGENDAVFYTSQNSDYIKYIESFGFKEEYGMYSDITIMERHFKKCGVNLSIGYKNNHTIQETLDLAILGRTIGRVIKICEDSGKTNTKYEYIPTFEEGYYRRNYGNVWGGFDRFQNDKIFKKHDKDINRRFQTIQDKNPTVGTCDNCYCERPLKIVKENDGYVLYKLCKKCRKKFYKGKLDISDMGTDYEQEEIIGEYSGLPCDSCGTLMFDGGYEVPNGVICEDCYIEIEKDTPRTEDYPCDYCGSDDDVEFDEINNAYLCSKCKEGMFWKNEDVEANINF